MEPDVVNTTDELDNFIDFLYEGLEGYVYVATKVPNSTDPKDWTGELIAYPKDKAKIKPVIQHFTKDYEVYLAPAIFATNENAKKENVKASNVAWVDFDGNAPKVWEGIEEPSLIIQSSLEGKQHVYWRLNEPLTNPKDIDRINRTLAYSFKADNSGWDACQVLRPPSTNNHKTENNGAKVRVFSSTGKSYNPDIFNSLTAPSYDVVATTFHKADLPDVQDVILRHALTPDIIRLLKMEKNELQDRSRSMQALAYSCAEVGMTDAEIFVVLSMADNMWEKYKGRPDRDRRLADIIVRARLKVPEPEQKQSSTTFAWGYKDFVEAEIKLDWVIEGMLMEMGNMMFVGPSGVGKTRFALEAMKHIALGKDFLHYKVPEPKKIGFLSLEMGHPDLQVFVKAQDQVLTSDERELLQQNLTIIPYGEAWPLNAPLGQERLKNVLDQYRWDGLFIDSVGSAILGNISSNDIVQPFLNFNDHIRNEFGLFLWYIHHTRKAQPGGGNGGSMDDIYGDQYLVARASSAYALLRSRAGSTRVRNLKNRLAKMEDDYFIESTDYLGFKKVSVPTPNIPGFTDKSSTDKGTDNDPPVGAGGYTL